MKNTKGQEPHSERDKREPTAKRDKSECMNQASTVLPVKVKLTKLSNLGNKSVQKLAQDNLQVLIYYKYHTP